MLETLNTALFDNGTGGKVAVLLAGFVEPDPFGTAYRALVAVSDAHFGGDGGVCVWRREFV